MLVDLSSRLLSHNASRSGVPSCDRPCTQHFLQQSTKVRPVWQTFVAWVGLQEPNCSLLRQNLPKLSSQHCSTSTHGNSAKGPTAVAVALPSLLYVTVPQCYSLNVSCSILCYHSLHWPSATHGSGSARLGHCPTALRRLSQPLPSTTGLGTGKVPPDMVGRGPRINRRLRTSTSALSQSKL